MSTFIKQEIGTLDQFATQIGAVAAVLTAFPATTLSGTTPQRFKTALAAKVTTPANAQIFDENGDVLAVTFASALPFLFYLTIKGRQRVELELADQTR